MTASVAAAIGFLAKGALAIALPACILLLWLLWERRLSSVLTPSVPVAALLLIVLLVPVLWAIEKHNPGFLKHFIIEEHFARFLGTRKIQLHPEPFWFYAKTLPFLMVPWTLFAFRAIRIIVIKRVLKNDSLTRFLLIWICAVVIFFSIGRGKLMSYILPAILPIGLVIGRWGIAPAPDGSRYDRWLRNAGATGLLFVAGTVVVIWTISFLQLIPDEIYPIRGISAVALVPMGIALFVVIWSRKFSRSSGLILFNSAILLTAALLLSPLAGKDFNVLIHINSSHVYKQLAKTLKPQDRIIVFWAYRPALAFYTQQLYLPFQTKNELAYGMQMEPERETDLQNKEELARIIMNCKGRVYALVEPKDLKTRFLPLKLRYARTDLPHDPDTLVFELLPPAK